MAVAAGFVPLALGTDTEGSIVSPANRNALYGLRPSTGLTSRTGVVPISISQDTTGPMAKSVRDIAITLEIMAAYDPEDPFSEAARPFIKENYTQFLDPKGFKGMRIGIPRFPFYNSSDLGGSRQAAVQATLNTFDKLRSLGATIVEAPLPNSDKWKYTFVGGAKRVNNGTIQVRELSYLGPIQVLSLLTIV